MSLPSLLLLLLLLPLRCCADLLWRGVVSALEAAAADALARQAEERAAKVCAVF